MWKIKTRQTMEQEMTYKKAMEEIEAIVKSLEDNQLDIDVLGERVKRAAGLIEFCKSKLRDTEEEVEKVLKSMEG